MKRRCVILFSILVMFMGLSTNMVTAQEVIKWKVQGFVPAGMLFHENLLRLADEIKTISNGRLIWEVFPAGALVPPFEGLKAVSDGVYQVNYGYTGQWVGKIPVAPLFTAAPGGMNNFDIQLWLEHGGGRELWEEMHARYKYNVKIFPEAFISAENFMWAKKPLRKIGDFKGLKMRMMPLMGDVLQKHGFSVVFMPAGEIMPNLQRGVIDAAEYSIPAFDRTLGIWEVCKYVMIPGIHQPASQTEILINKKAWDELPDDLKAIVEAAIWKTRLKSTLWMESKNLEAMDFFKQKGIQVVQMEPETVKTFVKWAWDYMDEMSKKDEFFGKVWNSQKAFMARWTPYAKMYYPRFER
jgi:TRAP-type mannitol/chloroaromatic compound transport system substrate-binding protein